MVALKHRHFGALLAICALVLSFFGVTQVVSASVPAHADAPACPAPVTNVSDKVTLDWDKAQLVDHTGHEVHAVGGLVGSGSETSLADRGTREGR